MKRPKQDKLVQALVDDQMLADLEREQERRQTTMSQLLREIIFEWARDK